MVEMIYPLRFILLITLFTLIAWSDPEGDYETTLRQEVLQGDLDAMHNLGRLLERKGSDFHQEALHWLNQAAVAGHAPAQYNLAVSQFNGDLGTKSLESAWMWMKLSKEAGFEPANEMLQIISDELNDQQLTKAQKLLVDKQIQWDIAAAKDGNINAAVRVGILLLDGQVVAKDTKLGLSFLMKASDAGDWKAMLTLAMRYERGRGLPKHLGKARHYYLLGAKQGSRRAMHELSRVLYNGGIAKPQPILALAWLKLAIKQYFEPSQETYEKLITEFDDQQIEMADKLASLGPVKLADSGWLIPYRELKPNRFKLLSKSPWPHDLFTNQSNRQLGYVVENLPKDLRQWRKSSFDFNEKSASIGQRDAMYRHALNLLFGLDGIKDLRKSIKLLEDAAARGHSPSASLLGFLTIVGPGVELESAKELSRLEMLSDRSDAEAQYLVAKIYQLGLQGKIDHSKARKFYELASAQGHSLASEDLADMYQKGLGGDSDDLKAWILLSSLVKKNWPEAKSKLDKLELNMGNARIAKAKMLASKPKSADKKVKKVLKPKAKAVTKTLSPLMTLTKKAESGSVDAQYDLAKLYFTGTETSKNYNEALKWLEKAASRGHGKACLDLSKMILKQKGSKSDLNEARKWLVKAVEKGVEEAKDNLHDLDMKRGQEAYEAYDNARALSIFEPLLKSKPNDPKLWWAVTKTKDSLGLDLFNAGKKAEAEKILMQAMESASAWQKSFPRDAQAYVYLAVTTGNLARFKGGKERVQIGSKVEGYCLKAIETDANVGRPYVILATYYWEVSKLNWMLKAFAKSFLGKLPDKTRDDALQLYLTGLEKDNNQIYGHFKIAQLYDALGQKENAQKHRKILMGLKAKNSGDQRILDELKKGS